MEPQSLGTKDRHFTLVFVEFGCTFSDFMPPTSEELRGHIALGLSICSSICISIMLLGSWEAEEPLILGTLNVTCT